MHLAPFDGGIGRAQGLAQHLAAEYLGTADVAAGAAEQVDLQAFQFQQSQQVRQ